MILIGLALVALCLAVSGTIGMLVATPRRTGAGVALPALGGALSLLELFAGSPSAALPVPLGFAGGSGGLALDPLSVLFLLLAFIVATAAAVTDPGTGRHAASRQLLLAAVALTLLAADVFLLAIGGILSMLMLARGSLTPDSPGAPAPGGPRRTLLAPLSLAGACALLAGLATPVAALLPDGGFALLRGSAVGSGLGRSGGLATLLLPILALAATGRLLGLTPWRSGPRRLAAAAAPSTDVPLLAGLLGLFLLLRLLLDLAGPTPPAWWGVALVLLGLASTLRSGVAGLSGDRLRTVIGSLLALQNALVVVAIGLCLLARAIDLPVLARAGLDAALLLLPMQLLSGQVALRLAMAVEAEAGAALLQRLGGLAQSMPQAALLGSVAISLPCFLPPAGGFVALWLLLQTALALCRVGGLASAVLAVALAAALLLVAVLSVSGWLRLTVVVFLGRPRTPRGAAAQDIAPPLFRSLAVLLAAPLLIGLLPGLWLRLLGPCQLLLASAADTEPVPWLQLASPAGGAALWPLPFALLVVLAFGGGLWAIRLLSAGRPPERREPAWDGGFAPPPAWLPFGDPLTQTGAAALPRALADAIGLARLAPTGRRILIARRTLRRTLRRIMRRATNFPLHPADRLGRLGGILALGLLATILVLAGGAHLP